MRQLSDKEKAAYASVLVDNELLPVILSEIEQGIVDEWMGLDGPDDTNAREDCHRRLSAVRWLAMEVKNTLTRHQRNEHG